MLKSLVLLLLLLVPDGHIHLPLRHSPTGRGVSSSREADRSIVVVQLLALHHRLHVQPGRHLTLPAVLVARLVVGERVILHRCSGLRFLLAANPKPLSLDREFLSTGVTAAIHVRIEFIICRKVCYAVLTSSGDHSSLLYFWVLVRWALI